MSYRPFIEATDMLVSGELETAIASAMKGHTRADALFALAAQLAVAIEEYPLKERGLVFDDFTTTVRRLMAAAPLPAPQTGRAPPPWKSTSPCAVESTQGLSSPVAHL